MMAGAAFVFAPIPAAAAAYVLIMGVAATRMLMTTDSWLITAIGPVYTGAMLVMVLINGRAFMQRKCLDIALEEREQTVSLLLREYESSRRRLAVADQRQALLPERLGPLRPRRSAARWRSWRACRFLELHQGGAAHRPGVAPRPRRGRGDDGAARDAFSELVLAVPGRRRRSERSSFRRARPSTSRAASPAITASART